MKKMTSFLLFALLCAAGASSADVHDECKQGRGKCPAAPLPPAPPAPPAPPSIAALPALPAPPAPPSIAALPAAPAPPAMPAVPAPPPAPAMPDIAVPAAAHAACAGKAEGSEVTYVIQKGEVMRGTCARSQGKMVFQLHTYRLDE